MELFINRISNFMSDEEKLAVKVTLDQAKYFLINLGDFYPFGTAFLKENTIKPLSIITKSNNQDIEEMITDFISIIEKRESIYKCACICVDGFSISEVDKKVKKNAIKIMLLNYKIWQVFEIPYDENYSFDFENIVYYKY